MMQIQEKSPSKLRSTRFRFTCWVFFGLLLSMSGFSTAAPMTIDELSIDKSSSEHDAVLALYTDIQRLRLSHPDKALQLTVGDKTIALPAAAVSQLECQESTLLSGTVVNSTSWQAVVGTLHSSFEYAHSVIYSEMLQVARHLTVRLNTVLPAWASDLLNLIW